MKAVFLSLFCALFLFSFVVEANFQITDSQLRYGGSSTHKREFFSNTLALSNAFTDCHLRNINLQFVERNDFRRSNININETTLEINFSQTGSTLVTITTTDFDIIDEELEERGEVEIGTLSLQAEKFHETNTACAGSVTSNTLPVKLQLKNDLNLLSVEMKGPDGDFETISEDSTKTILVDEDYDLRFKIRNTFESSSDIDLENINIQIESDDLDIDKTTTLSEIAAGEEGEKTTTVSVDATGSGEVRVLVSGDDSFGGKHGRVFTFNFAVEEAEEEEEPADENDGDGDGVPDERDECLDTVSVCDVDAVGCPIDSDADGTCDALDPTPRPIQRDTGEEEIDTSSGNGDKPLEDATQKTNKEPADDSTSGFIPFLIGFAVGIMVTAGFSVLIKS